MPLDDRAFVWLIPGMPIKFTIDHEKRFVGAKADGPVTRRDVEDFTDALVAQDALTYRKLFDATDAAGTYNDDDVMALAARATAYASLSERGPLALVPRRDTPGDLAKRYVNLGRFSGQAKIFTTADEARAWLDSLTTGQPDGAEA
jgi:hypothetical protein